MGWFDRERKSVTLDACCLWGDTCFAEYKEDRAGSVQPWCVQKYDTDWCFYLDCESDVVELIKRLDRRARFA